MAAYEERSFEAFRAYYDYVPKGRGRGVHLRLTSRCFRPAADAGRSAVCSGDVREIPNESIEVFPEFKSSRL